MLVGGLAGIWAKQSRQPVDGALIVFPFAAHITDPGREIGHRHKLVIQPGKIRDELQAHHPGLALVTWKTGKIMIIAQGTPASFKVKTLTARYLLNSLRKIIMVDQLPLWERPVNQDRLANDFFDWQHAPGMRIG